jgi:assimilatory nitrate reductase catalytic subunit
LLHWSRAAVDGGWVYELTGAEPPDQGMVLARGLLDASAGHHRLDYFDRRGPGFRAAAIDADGRMAEALLVGRPGRLPARDWLVSLLASEEPLSPADRPALLSGRSPAPLPAKGRIVCSCFNVGVNELAATVAGGYRTLQAIGSELKAGTNCGSCRSEIRAIIEAGRVEAAE